MRKVMIDKHETDIYKQYCKMLWTVTNDLKKLQRIKKRNHDIDLNTESASIWTDQSALTFAVNTSVSAVNKSDEIN